MEYHIRLKETSMKDEIIQKMFEQTVREAMDSIENIKFFINNVGRSIGDLNFSFDSLDLIEKEYRIIAKENKFTDQFDEELFEKFITHFLGETLIKEYGAEWYAYKGKIHTNYPIIIKFDNNNGLDISVLCNNLARKKLQGSNNGTALSLYAKRAKKLALIKCV